MGAQGPGRLLSVNFTTGAWKQRNPHAAHNKHLISPLEQNYRSAPTPSAPGEPPTNPPAGSPPQTPPLPPPAQEPLPPEMGAAEAWAPEHAGIRARGVPAGAQILGAPVMASSSLPKGAGLPVAC
ncbi:hypothetical protein DPEC_G00360460 [Dallia pectoralis]|uniref:Uncharacterized protein n=1 Tax=Dallia pectoralis TaxID=75939 RepID=A0ACC2F0U9_DALPE|nr:hypothetical protein DPEC_G00360460 [Dallia pectoralis]